jgi:hypothetical protein
MGDEPRTKVGTAVRGALLVLVGLVLFDFPAAYLASKHYSPWLSLAAGLLTFPLLALVWHAFGERARKRKELKKAALTKGYERWLLRSATVGLLVVGALFALAGPGRMWTAFRHHALWFLPDGASALVADSKLLDQVPPDAEAVVWIRFDDDVRAAIGKVVPLTGQVAKVVQAPEVVIAVNKKSVFVAEQGDTGVVDIAQELIGMVQGLVKQFSPEVTDFDTSTGSTSGGAHYLVSTSWKAQIGKGKPTSVIDNMALAPDDAWLVIAIKPTSAKDMKDVQAGALWSRIHRGRLELAGRVDFTSSAAATAGLAELREDIAKDAAKNECFKRFVHVDSEATGATVRVSLTVNVDELEAAVDCVK